MILETPTALFVLNSRAVTICFMNPHKKNCTRYDLGSDLASEVNQYSQCLIEPISN